MSSFELNGKVIAVIGATGLQGGSVAKYLLKDGRAKVRAITRNADSEAAKELKKAGAEVVVANIDDVASLEKAFTGAYGVFGVTDFWQHYYGTFAAVSDEIEKSKASEDKEVEQGRNIVDAVKKTGIKHFVWSTIWHVEKEEDRCPHFESKYKVDQYAKKQGVPLTSVYTAMYYENLTAMGGRLIGKNDDGSYVLNLAVPLDTPLPAYPVNETGGWVLPAFADPNKWIGKDVYALGEHITTKEMAAALSEVFGKQVHPLPIPLEVFLDPNGVRKQIGTEYWLNLKAFYDHPPGPKSPYDAGLSKAVYPGASTFKQYAENDVALKALFL